MVEILGKVGFDWQVALANLINFFIVFYLIKRFLWKPIKKTIKDRKEVIDKGLEDARRAETTLMMAETEKQGLLASAHKESAKIAEEADKKAKNNISLSKKQGEIEAEKIKEDALRELSKKEIDMKKKLEKEYISLVIGGVEKLAMKEIDRSASEKFAESLIK